LRTASGDKYRHALLIPANLCNGLHSTENCVNYDWLTVLALFDTRLTTEDGYGSSALSGFPRLLFAPFGGPDHVRTSAAPATRFHAPSGFWCAQINGRRHYLDHDPAVAQRKLKKLLQDLNRGDADRRQWLDAPLSDLADEFLDDVKARKSPVTYRGYQEMLQLAMTHLGAGLTVGSIRKLHLTRLDQALHGNYSPTTIFKAAHALQRVFN
jgi:hypothetical protein